MDGEEIEANASISVLLSDLMDPLGEGPRAIKTTKEAAFILAQLLLRKIKMSSLGGLESDEIKNKIAGMICVITLANDDQNWRSKYEFASLQSARSSRLVI